MIDYHHHLSHVPLLLAVIVHAAIVHVLTMTNSLLIRVDVDLDYVDALMLMQAMNDAAVVIDDVRALAAVVIDAVALAVVIDRDQSTYDSRYLIVVVVAAVIVVVVDSLADPIDRIHADDCHHHHRLPAAVAA